MNFLHLKYAVEIEKTGSFSKAAENLYMGQPNLSKAIKELENETGITIFIRASRGVIPTEQGREFLKRAKGLVNSFEKLSNDYDRERSGMTEFSVAVSKSDHIATAFTALAAARQDNSGIRICYTEEENETIISKLLNFDIGMGILKISREKEKRYFRILDDAGIRYRTLWEYELRLLCAKDSDLSKKGDGATTSDLSELSEIIYADSDNSERIYSNTGKTIAIGDRGSRYDLLSNLSDAYMWTAPMPQGVLDRYNLVQLNADTPKRKCKDVLIYRNDYHMSILDEQFLSELEKVREDIMLDRKE